MQVDTDANRSAASTSAFTSGGRDGDVDWADISANAL